MTFFCVHPLLWLLQFFLRAFGNPTEKVKLHYLIGHAYARQGRADCATEQFRQALASRPQMAPCQRALDALNGVYNVCVCVPWGIINPLSGLYFRNNVALGFFFPRMVAGGRWWQDSVTGSG